MNGYLVLARCPMDDIPLRVCQTHLDAVACCERLARLSWEERLQEINTTAIEVLRLEVSDCYGLSIVPLRGGIPQRLEPVAFPEDKA
jgi:hypothetical protein